MAELGRGMLFPDRWVVDNDHEDVIDGFVNELAVEAGWTRTRTEVTETEAGWTVQSADPNYDRDGNFIETDEEPF